MNIIDTRTVLFDQTLSSAICALVIAFLWLQNRQRFRGLGFWFANFAMQFLLAFLVVLRGSVPDFISIVLANGLGACGMLLLLMGLERFTGRVRSQRINGSLLAAFVLIHIYFTYVQPDLPARSVNYSVITLLFAAQAAWLMIKQARSKHRSEFANVGYLICSFVALNVFRIFMEWNSTASDLFRTGIFNTLILAAYPMVQVSLTFALFLLVNHRLVEELGQDISDRILEDKILQARIRINDFASMHSFDELLQNSLDELCALTDSPIGFFHFVDPDQRSLNLQTWSTRTLKEFCKAEGKGLHYNIDQAGVWVDCVREKRPIIHNDYPNLPAHRGLPDGHAPVLREMVFPIVRNQQIVAIIGVGNKSVDYTDADIAFAGRLADLVWDFTERKRVEQALQLSESKFSVAFQSIPDGILIARMDDGKIIEVNNGFFQTTQFTKEDIQDKSTFDLDLWCGNHERSRYLEELEKYGRVNNFETNFRKKDGSVFVGWVSGEIVQLQDAKCTLSIIRDVTDRKKAEEKVLQQQKHMRLLYEASQQLNQTLELSEIYQVVCDFISANTPNDCFVISSYDSQTGLIICNAFWNEGKWLDVSDFPPIQLEDEGQGTQSRVIRNGKSLLFNDYEAYQQKATHSYYVNSRTNELVVAVSENEDVVRSAMIVPLKISNTITGVIQVMSYRKNAYSEDQLQLLESLGLHVAASQQNALLYSRVQKELRERTQVEAALIESEARYRTLITNVGEGIGLVDRDEKFIFANPAAEGIFGFPAGGLVGRNLIEFLEPDQIEFIQEQTRLRRSGEKDVYEVEIRCLDGEKRDLLVTVVPQMDNSGKLEGIFGVFRDISARKKIELSLTQRLMELEIVNTLSTALREGRSQQELLTILMKETLDSVNTSDGCILLVEPQNRRIKIAESRGWFKDVKDSFLDIHKEVIEHVLELDAAYILPGSHAAALGSEQQRNFIPLNSTGVFVPMRDEKEAVGILVVSFRQPQIVGNNQVRILSIIAQLAANAISRSRLYDQVKLFNQDLQKEIEQRADIQEQLAAEKDLLSTTLMNIADGVIVTDKEGRILLFNRSAVITTGYSLEEAISKPVSLIFRLQASNTTETVDDVINYLFQLEAAEKNQQSHHLPLLITHAGEKILVSGSITTINDSDDETTGFVIVFQDFSEKQKAQAQNVLSQKMQAIGQLAAGIAHEINTPAQYVGDNIKFLGKAFGKYTETITAFQKMLEEHIERPVTRDELEQLAELVRQKKITYYANEIPTAIAEALDGTDRIRKIVLAMREFSHPSEKEKKLSDINHGVETTVVISRNEWKYFADMETDLDSELPLVNCQIDEINQVILNMIVNAAQAIQEKMPPGSEQKGKISIQTRKCQGSVQIIIKDSGNGIPAEIIGRIFDPFFTTKGIGKGTGQGLSMAHNIIVNKHHGIIKVESEPGVGTAFTIELPVVTLAAEN